MKKIFLVFLFFSSICYSQDEALLGQWILDSIFDTDIYLINPVNPITTEFIGSTNSITIESFCGETYQTLYTTSTTENTIVITEANWSPVYCSEDNQGWEVAINTLFNITNSNPKDLTYIITDNGTTTSLEISYNYLWQGAITGTTGYFTKLNTLPGEWFLYSLNSNGVNYDNNFGNLPIDFLEETNNYSELQGTSSCNGFNGSYDINGQIIEITLGGVTLLDCPGPRNGFENTYLDLLSNTYTYPSIFNYEIEGVDMDQVLTLTNTNGDFIIYGKIEPNTILNRTWYIDTVTSNGLTYSVVPGNSAHLTLDPTVDEISIETLEFYGSGDCNDYIGNYNQGNSTITITEFTQTTDLCNPQSDFEATYFSLLSDESANVFNFEIINDGSNLILTSIVGDDTRSIGDTLIFSRQLLSIDENTINKNSITLLKNPVKDLLHLKFSESLLSKSLDYTIYTADGKAIETSILSSDSINVSTLNLGLYFISFSSNSKLLATHKFIKK